MALGACVLDQFRLQCRQFEVLGSGFWGSMFGAVFRVHGSCGPWPRTPNREPRTSNLEPNPEPSTQNPERRHTETKKRTSRTCDPLLPILSLVADDRHGWALRHAG